ncbi:hypothetical protein YTPLAS18_16080 [Nitrospira sp.]|nr:hypothetical protein YTPLAS18_16080 [Nitrospira sp.]
MIRQSKGVQALVFAMVAAAPFWAGTVWADPMSGQKGKDAGTDLTEGKSATPDEYSDTPVRQGKLEEVKNSKWLNHHVKSSEGKDLGKIEQILKDKKTGDIEYAVLSFEHTDRLVPMRWSQFKEQGDRLKLNVKEEEFKKTINEFAPEDTSPDVRMYMKQIEDVRNSKFNAGQKKDPASHSATGEPAAAGTMGEEKTTGGGAGGPQGLPTDRAPGLEGGHPSSPAMKNQ